ncbi:sterol desaturase [Chloropicon primus]|uniref:Sterol desaturase n=1 Tax=Chloropicon primus TaxID=1764295 RepID=A0A5B8MI97_9CHLO|nr:sterol desaturase [Chloropicon primus]UPQ99321.1 sterol desaturase [Chloropicon primus]|mmetsp:Transcript_13093/g.36791  ORF Transcript_13093/g.36791 Transcript_13093/m.36791 type:complete len:373 (+) Transcript_13093:223-1341(+)|eukprot:QDZ20109.1 sterol desaturase [Chloropicon primus]
MTQETIGSTARKALGFALACFVVRQVVIYGYGSGKRELRDLKAWTSAPGGSPNATQVSVPLTDWLGDWEEKHVGKRVHNFAEMDDRSLQRYLLEQESEWKNGLAFCLLPQGLKEAIKLDAWPLMARAWLRSFVFANLIYLGLGMAWAYYIYGVYGHTLFPKANTPKFGDVAEQVKVSLGSLPMYSFLPALCEHIVERGWTLAYVRMDEYSYATYFASFFLYMFFVEFGVYWNHRLLHDLRLGYDKLHYIHHKYNKENTLSPFAGLAFHPLDGILQAVPYFWTLFVFPMHALTYELMLFGTAVWTTNIHDCVEVECQPIMGAGYHTIHHTTYRHNYGQFFTYMDRLFGTILYPENSGKQHRNPKSVYDVAASK